MALFTDPTTGLPRRYRTPARTWTQEEIEARSAISLDDLLKSAQEATPAIQRALLARPQSAEEDARQVDELKAP